MIGLKARQAEEQRQAAAAAAAAALEPSAVEAAPADASKPAAAQAGGGAAAESSAGRGRGGRGTSIWGVKGAAGVKQGGRRLRPGEIRVQKDISELDGGDCATANFPNPNDLMNFEIVVAPDQGYWQGYQYTFQFVVPDMYPHEPPKVHCVEKIYHPNIDLGGNVCLNILRADWKPVLDINAVIYGLIVLFTQPNPNDPLNHDAAKCLRDNHAKFKLNVDRSLRGMDVDGQAFPPAKRAVPKKSS